MDLETALKKYRDEFSGIVKFKGDKIIYPTPQRLNRILFTINNDVCKVKKEINRLESQINEYKGEKSFFKKITTPLYYKHLIALINDKDYAETVKKIPYFDELFYRENGRKIIEKLIKDKKYREDFLRSIKYKTIDIKKDFIDKYNARIEILTVRLNKLKEMLKKLNEQKKVIKVILDHLKKQEGLLF